MTYEAMVIVGATPVAATATTLWFRKNRCDLGLHAQRVDRAAVPSKPGRYEKVATFCVLCDVDLGHVDFGSFRGRRFAVRPTPPCEVCMGTGVTFASDGSPLVCRACSSRDDCKDCDGTGYAGKRLRRWRGEVEEPDCARCRGTGRVGGPFGTYSTSEVTEGNPV